MTDHPGLVAGQVAVVAGAGSGIGRAVAAAYVREGGRVLVADRSGAEQDVAREIGSAATPLSADMTDPARVESMVREAHARHGRLDAVINTVGVCDVFDPIVDLDPADFDRIVRVNLTSAFLSIKYAVPLMRAAGGGSIVTFSSVGGFAATEGIAAYSAAKAGIVMLTRSAALEYGPDNIRVNAVCPGPIRTPMNEPVFAEPGRYDALRASIAMDRVGEPDEVAEMAVVLASDRASFVTGVALPVDGGRLVSADSRRAATPEH
ncbi:SDR family NAD(P)-dependent oxidoreductase [Nocardioides humi]|uniref:SDR family oxidoreductase n=1 Tax=Nocardioides humi TaxID=449461 RepID=A0ABN2BE64_9ACTN|nr:SDR family oxidoreductase [Nocardioides humi]